MNITLSRATKVLKFIGALVGTLVLIHATAKTAITSALDQKADTAAVKLLQTEVGLKADAARLEALERDVTSHGLVASDLVETVRQVDGLVKAINDMSKAIESVTIKVLENDRRGRRIDAKLGVILHDSGYEEDHN